MADSLSADMRTVKQQMLAPLLEESDVHRAGRVLASLSPDGHWSDVDYADQDRAVWKTSRHLGNLLTLSRAYRAPTSEPIGRVGTPGEVAESVAWLCSDGGWLAQ